MNQIFDHWNYLTSRTGDELSCLLDAVLNTSPGFPPYDVERNVSGDTIVSVALAGLKRDDIEIFVDNEVLNIKYDWYAGNTKPSTVTNTESSSTETLARQENALVEVFHKGITRRSFNLKFRLTPGTEVLGATMEDGLLRIQLRKDSPKSTVKKIEIQ